MDNNELIYVDPSDILMGDPTSVMDDQAGPELLFSGIAEREYRFGDGGSDADKFLVMTTDPVQLAYGAPSLVGSAPSIVTESFDETRDGNPLLSFYGDAI